MDLVQATILALVQALTEFLPISSSAHLVLTRWLLGWEDPGLSFDVALHFGTLLALTAYFLRTWIRIAVAGFGGTNRLDKPDDPDHNLAQNPRMLWYLAAATIPAAVAGLALQDVIEQHLRSQVTIGAMLIAVGALILWADRTGTRSMDIGRLSLGACLLIGCAQALALVPGTSRAGITIAAGLLLGLERQAAARFSFLLAMPIVLGASLKTGASMLADGGSTTSPGTLPLVVGIVVAAIAGYAVIALFLRYLQRATLAPFVYYRFACGIIVLVVSTATGLRA